MGFSITPGSEAANILSSCATDKDKAFLPQSGIFVQRLQAIGRDITRPRTSADGLEQADFAQAFGQDNPRQNGLTGIAIGVVRRDGAGQGLDREVQLKCRKKGVE